MATFRDRVELLFDVDDTAYRKGAARLKRQARKDGQTIQRSLFGAAALGTAAFAAVREFASFERGLSKVQQRTKLADVEIEKMGKAIQSMSMRTTASTDELLDNAAAVAQLGLEGTDTILKYTEVVAKMSEATVLEGEAAAFALARISNLTNTSHDMVENVASSIVELGNNFPAVEDQIAESAQNIAASIRQFGATAPDVLGLGTAVAAMGQDGAKAATAIGKAMGEMNVAVLKGGKQLDAFANIMGVDAVEATRLWKDNSVDAFNQFIVGVSKGGDEAQLLLESVGLMDQRTNRVLMALAANSEHLAKALDVARQGFEDGTALAQEYAISMNNLQGRATILRNKLQVLVQEMGRQLAPTAEAIVGFFDKMITEDTIKHIARYAVQLARLTAGFIAAKIAIAGARLAILGLRAAALLSRNALRAMWAAGTLGLTLFFAYLPEIITFFGKHLPKATSAAGKMLKALGLSFVQVGQVIITAWTSAIASIVERIDGLAQRIAPLGKVLGVDIPTGFSKGFTAAADGAKQQMGRIAADITGLKDSAKADFASLFSSVVEDGKKALDDFKKYSDVGLVIPEGDDPDSVNAGGEAKLTKAQQQAAERRKQEIRKMSQFEIAARKAAADEQRRQIIAQQEEEQRLLDEQNARELEKLQAKLDLEAELRRMAQEGKTAQELEFYEQEQELIREREELKEIEDAARRGKELELNALQFVALQKQEDAYYAAKEAKAKAHAQKETADHLNYLATRSKKAAGIIQAAARAEALHYLAAKAPVDASAAFGNAMRHIPAPFNLAAAPAAYAAVMAKAVAAVASAKEVKIAGMREGGMIGGGFSLGDSQLRMVKPGEAMIPDKKWSAVENAIAESMKRGDYSREDDRALPERELNEERVQIQFDGEAGALLRRLDDQTAVLRTG